MIWLLLAVSASAFKPICHEDYLPSTWASALDEIDAHLAAGEVPAARERLIEVHRALLCMRELAPTPLVGKMAQELSLAFFYDQDPESSRRWALLARAAQAPALDETRFPEGHPYQELLAEIEPPGKSRQDKFGFAIGKGGGTFLNGELVVVPEALAEVPGLFQVYDKKGEQVDIVWIDGSAFPEEFLGPPGTVPVLPKAMAKAKATKRPVSVAKVGPSPVIDAAAAASLTDDELVKADTSDLYVDPFTDARRRALLHEVSERKLMGEGGEIGVVRTEVLTFLSDPSNGGLVTQGHYAKWLADYSEWKPGGRAAAKQVGEGYLAGWQGAAPASAGAPVTGLSFRAASAYCGSWGNTVAPVAVAVHGALAREWRSQGEEAVLLGSDGAVVASASDVVVADAGFRCRP